MGPPTSRKETMRRCDPSRDEVQAVQVSKPDPSDSETSTLGQLGHGPEAPHEVVTPTCPRCCCAPLRFVPSGDCLDSTGGGTYRCVPCGYSTARDLLVEDLLRELRDVRDLLKRFAQMALPGVVRELVAPDHRCPECEAKWHQAVVDAAGADSTEKRRIAVAVD